MSPHTHSVVEMQAMPSLSRVFGWLLCHAVEVASVAV
jgi:hypothetical protein